MSGPGRLRVHLHPVCVRARVYGHLNDRKPSAEVVEEWTRNERNGRTKSEREKLTTTGEMTREQERD